MSKGFGVKQRLILSEVEKRPWGFYLIELLPANHTEADYQSLYRAFSRLYKDGHIGDILYCTGTKHLCQYGKVFVIKQGLCPPPNRPAFKRKLISVKGIT